MVSQIRRDSAEAEIGRRHPWWTLHGRKAIVAAALLVLVFLARWAWVSRPSFDLSLSWSPWWLLLPAAGFAVWLFASPSRRLSRQIRRSRR